MEAFELAREYPPENMRIVRQGLKPPWQCAQSTRSASSRRFRGASSFIGTLTHKRRSRYDRGRRSPQN
jgi:hypothetical protein